ncbi:MAG: cysteine-rich CWC family protein [Polyangiaceae bacterium]
MPSAVDPSLCPTCGEPNTCGMSQGKSECWCFSASISPAALQRIPAEAKGLACICPRCAQAASVARAQEELAPHE